MERARSFARGENPSDVADSDFHAPFPDQALRQHNRLRHDGEPTAHVCGSQRAAP